MKLSQDLHYLSNMFLINAFAVISFIEALKSSMFKGNNHIANAVNSKVSVVNTKLQNFKNLFVKENPSLKGEGVLF